MCKNNIPSLDERNETWIHKDWFAAGKDAELDLIVNTRLMPKWEARGYNLPDVNAFREKMNEPDLPGESAVFGTHKPGDRATRRKATTHTKKRHEEMMRYSWSYEPINRAKNGKYNHLNLDEFRSSVVATKKKSKSEAQTFFNRIDRRKVRHDGRAECREIPEYIADDAEEENREFYPEKADGTVDVDFCLRHNWLYADLDDGIYGAEYDDDDEEMESYEEYLERENSQLTRKNSQLTRKNSRLTGDNSRLTREINTYKDFLGEFNLNKLYQTWLAQNGKGEGK